MTNLEECVHSAEVLVSAACTIITTRSTVAGGSVVEFTAQKRLLVKEWINTTPTQQVYNQEEPQEREIGLGSIGRVGRDIMGLVA